MWRNKIKVCVKLSIERWMKIDRTWTIKFDNNLLQCNVTYYMEDAGTHLFEIHTKISKNDVYWAIKCAIGGK